MFLRFAWLLPIAAGLGLVASLGASPIVREPGAIYLSDFQAKPMKLQVLQPAPATFDLAGTRYVGTLRAGQFVDVQAIADQAYRVRGNAQQGQVLGWVAPEYLQPIAPETLEALRKSEERRRTVAALIEKNEIAMGMTPEEVQLSVGKPQKKTTKAAQGQAVEEVWEFVKYASIPQQTNVVGPGGVVTIATTFVKTPVGRLTVTFKEGVVTAIDQSEGTVLNGNQTTIVAPPIVIAW